LDRWPRKSAGNADQPEAIDIEVDLGLSTLEELAARAFRQRAGFLPRGCVGTV